MTLAEKLELLVTMDPSQAVSSMRNLATQTDKSVRASESSLKSLSSTALKIGASGIGVGGFLTMMASGDIEAANQLKAAIGQTGHAYDEYSDRVDDAIAAQVRFGHTDEEVNNALSTLTLSYNDAGKALDQMQLVADLAARKHISLQSAAELVAKAHGGAGRVFKEFGIEVDSNAKNTDRYDQALTELAGKLQGQASASADTFTGRLKALGALTENFVSDIGQKYGPAILGLSTGLTALGGISSGAGKAIDVLKARHAAAALAAELQAKAELELAGAEKAAGTSALGAAGQIGLLAAALFAGAKGLDTLFGGGGDDISTHFKSAIPSVQDFTDNLGKMRDQARVAGDSLEENRGVSDEWAAGVAQRSIPAAENLATALEQQGYSSANVRQAIADQAAGERDAAAASEGTTVAAMDAAKAYEEQRKALEQLNTERLKEIDIVTGAQTGVIRLSDAEIRARESINELNTSTQDATLSEDQHKSALNDAESAIITAGEAAKDFGQKQAEAAGYTDTASAASASQITELQGVAATLAPGSPLRVWLDQYIATLLSTPTAINTQFTASGPGGGPPQIKVGSGQVVHSAGGQRNFRGGFSWVGEQGPELLEIPRGSNIYTNRESMAMTGGGGQIIQHIYAATDPWQQQRAAQQERAKARYLSMSGR